MTLEALFQNSLVVGDSFVKRLKDRQGQQFRDSHF